MFKIGKGWLFNNFNQFKFHFDFVYFVYIVSYLQKDIVSQGKNPKLRISWHFHIYVYIDDGLLNNL